MKNKKFSITRDDYLRYRINLDNPTAVDEIYRTFYNYVNSFGYDLDLPNFRMVRRHVFEEGVVLKRTVIENGRKIKVEWPVHGMDVHIDMDNNLQDIVRCLDVAFEVNFVVQTENRMLLAIF